MKLARGVSLALAIAVTLGLSATCRADDDGSLPALSLSNLGNAYTPPTGSVVGWSFTLSPSVPNDYFYEISTLGYYVGTPNTTLTSDYTVDLYVDNSLMRTVTLKAGVAKTDASGFAYYDDSDIDSDPFCPVPILKSSTYTVVASPYNTVYAPTGYTLDSGIVLSDGQASSFVGQELPDGTLKSADTPYESGVLVGPTFRLRDPAPVPEPSALTMIGAALSGGALLIRRRK